MLAEHVYRHGDVLAALCPILLIVWLVLLILGVLGLLFRRPLLLDPIGSTVVGVILLAVWLAVCWTRPVCRVH